MGSLLARCLGITKQEAVAPEMLVVMLERRSTLSRAEARIVLLDYLGYTRDDITTQLQISLETLKTYWKRIYRKLACRDRLTLRVWVEQTIGQELE